MTTDVPESDGRFRSFAGKSTLETDNQIRSKVTDTTIEILLHEYRVMASWGERVQTRSYTVAPLALTFAGVGVVQSHGNRLLSGVVVLGGVFVICLWMAYLQALINWILVRLAEIELKINARGRLESDGLQCFTAVVGEGWNTVAFRRPFLATCPAFLVATVWALVRCYQGLCIDREYSWRWFAIVVVLMIAYLFMIFRCYWRSEIDARDAKKSLLQRSGCSTPYQ